MPFKFLVVDYNWMYYALLTAEKQPPNQPTSHSKNYSPTIHPSAFFQHQLYLITEGAGAYTSHSSLTQNPPINLIFKSLV